MLTKFFIREGDISFVFEDIPQEQANKLIKEIHLASQGDSRSSIRKISVDGVPVKEILNFPDSSKIQAPNFMYIPETAGASWHKEMEIKFDQQRNEIIITRYWSIEGFSDKNGVWKIPRSGHIRNRN